MKLLLFLATLTALSTINKAAPWPNRFKVMKAQLNGECNSYDREKLNEGYKLCVYKDSLGIPKIGVGFNLKKGWS